MVSESVLVAAAFPEQRDAEAAVRDLGSAGIGDGAVSLMYTDTRHMAEQGLKSGLLFGGVVGGLVGLLFPPLGVVVAAGPILGAVASAVTTGATVALAGGALSALTGALVQIGMPKEIADDFGGHIHKGDALVIVHASRDQSQKVKDILAAHNPRTETSEGPEGGAVVTPAAMPGATQSA